MISHSYFFILLSHASIFFICFAVAPMRVGGYNICSYRCCELKTFL